MKTYKAIELEAILSNHAAWLDDPNTGRRAGLGDANLKGANLKGANLTGANLTGANLKGANLRDADLRGANLRDADLRGANLTGANLAAADLAAADLTGANLTCANLAAADLTGADLAGANLRDADLRGANLTCANLMGRSVCPSVGAFTAFKSVRGAILELLIPADARRVSALCGRKCRASKVLVVRAIGSTETTFRSKHDSDFVYRVGEIAQAPTFDPDIRIECTSGIHFFMEQGEAESY